MKIAVIAGYRTRSTALQEYLSIKYNCKNLFEYFNERYNADLKNQNSKPYHILISNLTDNLLNQNNFVTKIMGGQLKIVNPDVLSALQLNKFDQLHLIERNNFFDSCVSYHIARYFNIWFYEPTRNNTVLPIKLSFDSVWLKAVDLANYLSIKKYLIDHAINFDLHNYDSEIFNGPKIGEYHKGNFDYKNLITNYSQKDTINNLFNQYFNYQTCNYDLASFKKKLFLNNIL